MVASFSDCRSCFWAWRSSSIVLLLALEELRVLDGEGGVAGQRLRRLQAVRAEGGRGLLVVHVDRAQGARRAAPRRRSARGERSGMQTIVRRSMRMTLWACRGRGRPPRSRWRPSRRSRRRARTTERGDAPSSRRAGGWPRAGGPRAGAGRRPRGSGRPRRELVGEEQEAALGPRDPHDRVEHLLEDLAQDEGRVEGLHQREQELLLLDPGELRRSGRCEPSPVRAENFRVTLPSWICAPGVSSLRCTRAALT